MTQHLQRLPTVIASAALFLGSFGDEAAQVVFALRLVDGSQAQVSALLIAGLIGGIFAGTIAPRIISRCGVRATITGVFAAEAGVIALAAVANLLAVYLLAAALLGCAGSILWSAVMVALPTLSTGDKWLEQANRLVQSVRNLGFVVGPLCGSLIYAHFTGTNGVLVLSALMLAATILVFFALRHMLDAKVGRGGSTEKQHRLDTRGLLRTRGVARAFIPLFATVIVSSAVNVLLIVRIRSELGYSAESYGIIVGAAGAGMVLGPMLLAGLFSKLGDASGAAAAGAGIGLGIATLGLWQALPVLLLGAAVIGLTNGVLNALMASFLMKRISAQHRVNQMPAYVMLTQLAVFVGFAAAAFIPAGAAGITLTIVGFTAAVISFVGVFTNLTNR